MNNKLSVAAGEVVDIDLNGYVLDFADGSNGMTVKGVLNVYDSRPTSENYWDTSTMPYVYLGTDASSGGINIEGGAMTGAVNRYEQVLGERTTTGSAITCLSGSELNWYGGNVIGNKSEIRSDDPTVEYQTGVNVAAGAAVSCDNASAKIYEGVFAGNISADGEGDGFTDSDGNLLRVLSTGGAFYADKAASLEIGKEVQIRNNQSVYSGGGIHVQGNSSVAIYGSIFENIALYGGGTYFSASEITSSGDIYGNVASASGGGIYTGKAKVVNNGAIHDNEAVYGAGIYAISSTFLNTAPVSNNIASASGGGMYANECDSRNEGEFTSNSAQYGGGIVVSKGEFTNASNANVSYNESSLNGAGVYVVSATLFMNEEGGAISSNSSTGGSGGGIYATGAEKLINNGIVSENSGNFGGGISSYCTMTVNSATAEIRDNIAKTSGGGIYVGRGTFTNDGLICSNTSTYGAGIYTDTNTDSVVNTGKIDDNTASTRGGGVSVACKNTFLNSGDISNNMSYTGGGIYASSQSLTVENTESGKIFNNVADYVGGGIAASPCSVNNYGNVYSNTGKYGGGIYLSNGAVFANDGNIYNNTATASGGGTYANEATLTNNGKIYGNNASYGGGSYCDSSTIAYIASETSIITNNTATQGAGVQSGGPFENFGEISHNIASTNGGGIYVPTTGNVINHAEISSNTANFGGGVLSFGQFANTSEGVISNNQCSASGAGIYVQYSGEDSSITNTNDGTISNNKGKTGGGAYVNGVGSFINNGSITNNLSTAGGGGVSANGTCLFVNNGSISKNIAEGSGGGINIGIGGTCTNNGMIQSNSASVDGGGVNMSYASSLSNSGDIVENTCGQNGGGVWLSNLSLIETSGNISYNTSSNNGGGICMEHSVREGYESQLSLISGNIIKNSAMLGGGIYSDGNAVISASVAENTATERLGGSGVYVASDSLATTYLGGVCIIDDNVAENGPSNNFVISSDDSIVNIHEDYPLLDGAKIGCSVLSPDIEQICGIVTDEGYAQVHYEPYGTDPNEFFYSDNENYYVGLTGENEVVLYQKLTMPEAGNSGITRWIALSGIGIMLIAIGCCICSRRKRAAHRHE